MHIHSSNYFQIAFVFFTIVVEEWRENETFSCRPQSGAAVGGTFPPSVGGDYCHSAFENNEHSVCRLPHTTIVWALRQEEERVMDRKRDKAERVEAERVKREGRGKTKS